MSNTDPYSRSEKQFEAPPRGFNATLRQLGPGMILAGSIVGSGELIMTTKLGAVAGFTFLWFVLLSCFIKVVVQAELARHTISSGETFLRVFNGLPGPAGAKPRWLTLRWLATVLFSSAAALAVFMNLPDSNRSGLVAVLFALAVVGISSAAAWLLSKPSLHRAAAAPAPPPRINWFTWLWLGFMLLTFINSGAILGAAGQTLQMLLPNVFGENGSRFWGIVVAVMAALLLLSGRYATLERMFIFLVATFTALTLVCTVLLQWTGFGITWTDVGDGLSFGMPPMTVAITMTALAMYAGTGVAYGEMWNYTYWCVEKGYARNAGAPTPDQDWPVRAKGWIRVMYIDVLFTMVVYTISTVCFYILGAAVLHVQGLNPDGPETIGTLSKMYTDSLGNWSATLFVVGSFFVLLTTVLAGVAGTSRLMADALGVMGIIDSGNYAMRLKFIRVFVVLSLTMFTVAYWLFQNPPRMLALTSSVIGAVMYPVLGLGVLYLRHKRVDPRIRPGTGTTVWLWISAIALTIISPGGILLAMALENGWIGG